MAVTRVPISKTVSVVLDKGTVSGKQKTASVSIGSDLKTNAADAACWAYANSVAGLYEEDPLRYQVTDRAELADS